MSSNPPPNMAENPFSQFLTGFQDFSDLQGATAGTEGLLDDHANSTVLNNSLQTFMSPPASSSSQPLSLPSLPQPSFNKLPYPNTALNNQYPLNNNNFFTPAPAPAPAQNTWIPNQHNVPNDFQALIQPQALVAASVTENTPEYPMAHGHFYNPGSSSAFMGPGQPVNSGWVPSASSIPFRQPGGVGISLTAHQDGHTHTQDIDVVPQAIHVQATTSENASSSSTSSVLPSIPPASNRPDLPYVLCCFPDCYKIYQGMEAFTAHIRSSPTDPDPGHLIKTFSTTSSASQDVQCAWQGCTEPAMKLGSLFRHTERHALIDWLCAVPGCGVSLSTKSKALKHFADKHEDIQGGYPMDWDRVYEIPAKHRRN